MIYKTTKKEFNEFKKEAKYWIDYFGLKNWDVYFRFTDLADDRARNYVDDEALITTLKLNTKWDSKPEKNEIKKCAFHEVCYLLLTPLKKLADKYYDHNYVAEQNHDIIRRLENTVFHEKNN